MQQYINKKKNMERKICFTVFSATLFVLLMFVACHKDDDNGVQDITISESKLEFDYIQSSRTIQVASAIAWKASVEGAADWVSVSPNVGIQHTEVTVSVEGNSEENARSVNIVFATKNNKEKVKITQQGGSEGVTINNITWATRNVDLPGTFARTSESAGMFYQWNRKVAWSSTDPMINSNNETTWDSTVPSGTTWQKQNDPCPDGWRIPTQAELQSLLDANNTWVVQNGVNGRRFGTAPNTIFLPAAGKRINSNGTLIGTNSEGIYWSDTQYDANIAYEMDFLVSNAKTDITQRNYAYAVRCVQE